MAGVSMIRLSPPWSAGAVLQHHKPHPLSGTAAPQQLLRITLKSAHQIYQVETQADALGRFNVEIPVQPPSGPWRLCIADSVTALLEVDDLWFGQLLLFAGQSNVGWPLAKYPDQLAAAQQHLATGSNMHFVRCYRTDPADFRAGGAWLPLDSSCCPLWPTLFYHLSQQLDTSQPMMFGMVDLSWPGSAIDAWLAVSDRSQERPWQNGALFSARLAPWLSQPFHSLVWYQGEQDAMAREAGLYQAKLQRWLDACRQKAGWEFPLLLLQIAGFGASGQPDPANGFVQVRLAQQEFAVHARHCALVSAADLGASQDIHPPFKAELARRLALTLQSWPQNPGLLQATLQKAANAICLTLPALAAGEHWQVRSGACNDNSYGEITGFYYQDNKGRWLAANARFCKEPWKPGQQEQQQIQLQLPANAKLLGYGITAFPALSLYTTQGLPLLPQLWPLTAEGSYCELAPDN